MINIDNLSGVEISLLKITSTYQDKKKINLKITRNYYLRTTMLY